MKLIAKRPPMGGLLVCIRGALKLRRYEYNLGQMLCRSS